ncbi:MAG: hypothetical protein IJ494_08785 [Bacteroides sp.]|nr:hypothetical protein [Bacteroides sp.]
MKTLRYIACVCSMCLLASCYEDKGNYDYHDINEVSVSGVPEIQEIDQYETLTITPALQGSLAGSDESNYEYEWKLNNKVISTEKDLVYEVTNATGSYTLRYSVINKDDLTKSFATTKLIVNSSTSSDGILVVSNQYGKADMSYLRLDKENAEFWPMFYNKSHDEPLAHNARQLYQSYVDGCKTFIKYFGGKGLKLVCDEGLLNIDNTTLEKNGFIDEEYFLTYGQLYPIPDYSGWSPEYVNSFVSQWRLSPYGSVFNNESLYVISGGAIYVIAFSRGSNPSIYTSNFTGTSDRPYKFSPMMCITGRTPTADKGKNLNAGWDGTYEEFVFDELSGKFFKFYYEDMTEIDSQGKSFPGYKAFYGEDTYQYELCFSAISNGSNVKFTTFDLANLYMGTTVVYDVDAPLVTEKSRFFMLRNVPYVYFNTESGIYKYNILNVQSQIAPSESDRICALSDFGYDSNAKIADVCMHRGEKKMLLAVSRYGNDTEGDSDELKTDIVEISLEGSKPTLLNKYTSVAGASPLVIYKYRTFARNDEKMVD